MRTVTCAECKRKVDKSSAIYEKPSYYHAECYEKKCARRELTTYICGLLGLKAPGPKIYSQRKRMMEEYEFTDEQILKTLQYMYEVKHLDKKKANAGIALVPDFFEEAMLFFDREQAKRVNAARAMDEAIRKEKTRETVVVKAPSSEGRGQRRQLKLLNPEEWWDNAESSIG